ncbi:RpiB/LacA/LacB family sugar-phosphate isomerase [bacterium]|nr:RpiB/LacA/LacB family sugar-phosphate isomerase [bacterium]
MIYLGADHRGFYLKEKIKTWLREWGLPFEDLGNTRWEEKDDYPDFAAAVAEKVSQHEKEAVGIVICGSGVGVDIVANRFPLIRCGLGFSAQQIKAARRDDDINMLALPADFLSYKRAKKIVAVFLKEEFDGAPHHLRRLKKIEKLGRGR